MDLLHTVFSLIITLGILITFHEFGHFWVARRCGVKVLRFSVGFGKPLLRWHDKQGTEYVIAALPLGGYVKMLDEREGNVPEALADQSFNSKSVGQRFAIVVAGPLANFLLAIVAYWFIFIVGTQVPAPLVGQVETGSPAALSGLRQGDEILSVNGNTTPSWQEVGLGLLARMGETTQITLNVQNEQDSYQRELSVQLTQFLSGQDQPDPFGTLGIKPWRPEVAPVLGAIQASGAAQQAGLQAGDKITAINNQPINSWAALVEQLQTNANTELFLTLERNQQTLQLAITPGVRVLEGGREVGFIGAGVQMPEWPAELLREQRFGPLIHWCVPHKKPLK